MMEDLSNDEKLEVIREVEKAYISAEERDFRTQQIADRKANMTGANKK